MATDINPPRSSAYHDTTKLSHLSGLLVGQELLPECEVIFEGGADKLDKLYNDCDKNPGHPNFFPGNEDGFKRLPEELQEKEILRSIKNRCNRTVRIVVTYTSEKRPDTFPGSKTPYPYSVSKGSKKAVRPGTGFIEDLDIRNRKFESCPCHECRKSPNPKMGYWTAGVITATHVIYDDAEAESSVFECFFDSDNRKGVKKLYGVSTIQEGFVPGSHFKSDMCYVTCVTHDRETVMRLSKEFEYSINDVFDFLFSRCTPPEGLIVSHPHGCSKRITVGNSLYITCPTEGNGKTNKSIPFWGDTICRLPMKPWLSDEGSSGNVQDEETAKIHNSLLQNLIEDRKDVVLNRKNLMSLVEPYLRRQSLETNLDGEKVYRVIFAIACGLYRRALEFDLIFSTMISIRRLDWVVSVLICHRLHNMKISSAKTPELIDIGLMLWKCCFTLLKDLFKDVFDRDKHFYDVSDSQVSLFLQNIYGWRPELLPLFDLHQYVTEKADTCVYSEVKDAEETVIRILTGYDSVTVKELGKENGAEDDDNRDDDYEGFYDKDDDKNSRSRKYGYLFETVPSFCHNVKQAFNRIQEHCKFYDKVKTLVGPKEDNVLQPGTEFLLPERMTFTLPPQAEYLCRFYQGKPYCFMFPPGTKFNVITPDHSFEFPLPDDAEFICVDLIPEEKCYITYNTETCPGSSGACLYCDFPVIKENINLVHSAGVTSTQNRSGLVFVHGNFVNICNFRKNFNDVRDKVTYTEDDSIVPSFSKKFTRHETKYLPWFDTSWRLASW